MDESWHMYRGEFGGSMRAKLEIAMRLLGNAPISANDNELYAWDATPEWSSADGQFDYFKNSEYAAGMIMDILQKIALKVQPRF